MPIPYKYEDSEKIFINILPQSFYSWPVVKEWPKNLTMLNIQNEFELKFPWIIVHGRKPGVMSCF